MFCKRMNLFKNKWVNKAYIIYSIHLYNDNGVRRYYGNAEK